MRNFISYFIGWKLLITSHFAYLIIIIMFLFANDEFEICLLNLICENLELDF